MASLLAFQIAVTLFCVFAITRVFLRFKDRQLSVRGVLFWLTVWLAVIVMVFLPAFLTTVANTAGIGRGVDFVLYVSIGALFYLAFRHYVAMQSLQRSISQLTTQIAIAQRKDNRKGKQQ